MMSRLHNYREGEGRDSQYAKSKRGSKVTPERVVLLVLCLLLAAAVIVICYLLFEIIKNREALENFEVKWKTVQTDLKERPSEMKPCSEVQPTCPQPTCPQPTCPQPSCPQPSCPQPSCPQPSCPQPTCPQPSCPQPTCPQLPEVRNDPCYKCEEAWEQHGRKCYFLSTSKSTWNESRDECITKGGDLVKIDSKEEQIFLVGRLNNIITDGESKFWIGLTDSAEEGRWLWVDGSPLNTSLAFWYSHEPDDWKMEDPDGEDCGRIGHFNPSLIMYWFDQPCKVPHRSICEKLAQRTEE